MAKMSCQHVPHAVHSATGGLRGRRVPELPVPPRVFGEDRSYSASLGIIASWAFYHGVPGVLTPVIKKAKPQTSVL